jgi:hypothetical protein
MRAEHYESNSQWHQLPRATPQFRVNITRVCAKTAGFQRTQDACGRPAQCGALPAGLDGAQQRRGLGGGGDAEIRC